MKETENAKDERREIMLEVLLALFSRRFKFGLNKMDIALINKHDHKPTYLK